jgi:general stress protein 26
MSEERSLHGENAIRKIKELADASPVCMFLTRLTERPIPARPMATQRVDDDGSIWFLSSRSSMKDRDIEQDPQIQLIYSDADSSEFMSILGEAEELDDKGLKQELWSPMAKTWFPKGVDDPDLAVIRVRPEDGYYWDTKDGRFVSIMKIMASSMTGGGHDGGVEGQLKP